MYKKERFIDIIERRGIRIPGDCVVVVADKHAEYLDSIDDGDFPEGYCYPASFYGEVYPPFDLFFVESVTSAVVEGESWVANRGIFCKAVRGDNGWAANLSYFIHVLRGEHVEHTNLDGYGDRSISTVLKIDNNGRVTTDLSDIKIGFDDRYTGVWLAGAAATLTPFFLLAISSFHKKDDSFYEVSYSRQVQRKEKRKHGRKKRNYYYIKVGDGKSQGQKQAKTGSSRAQRKHIVRGHWRYYHPDRPLFGHTTGAVFIPAHERGDGDEVKKRYKSTRHNND